MKCNEPCYNPLGPEEGNPVSNVFDGDVNSIYHSRWRGQRDEPNPFYGTEDHFIDLVMEGVDDIKDIDKIKVTITHPQNRRIEDAIIKIVKEENIVWRSIFKGQHNVYTFKPNEKEDPHKGKKLLINLAPASEKNNDFYTSKDTNYDIFHCDENTCNCENEDCDVAGFLNVSQLRGFRLRDCKDIEYKFKTLGHVNTNNPLIIKTPYGKGKYELEIGLGDCRWYRDQYPRLVLEQNGLVYNLINSNEHNNKKASTIKKEINITSDNIKIYDPRESVSGRGTSNERLVIEERNILQPTRIGFISLKKL